MGKMPWWSKTLLINLLMALTQILAGDKLAIDPNVKIYVVLAINILLRFLSGQPIVLPGSPEAAKMTATSNRLGS